MKFLGSTLILLGAALLLSWACNPAKGKTDVPVQSSPDGPRSWAAAKSAIRQYGCQTCHVIPGIVGATGTIGPSLDGIADRYYLAGQLPNTPENLSIWIQHPHSVNPNTVMPEMNVSDEDSRNIAVYLETLR